MDKRHEIDELIKQAERELPKGWARPVVHDLEQKKAIAEALASLAATLDRQQPPARQEQKPL